MRSPLRDLHLVTRQLALYLKMDKQDLFRRQNCSDMRHLVGKKTCNGRKYREVRGLAFCWAYSLNRVSG